jgi:predicted nuclease with TOPRIM domain
MNKDQMFERRGQLMEALAEVVANQANFKEALAKLDSRLVNVLDDLKVITAELNRVLEEEAKEKAKEEGAE